MSRFRFLALSASIIAAVLVMAVVLLVPGQAAAAGSSRVPMEIIASGLDNPRHLEFGPDGALYVAEAGTGGDGPQCLPNGNCYGTTGAVTRIDGGTQSQVVTGLPSLAPPSVAGPFAGLGATGPHALTWDGSGQMFVAVGLGSSPTQTMAGGALDGLPFAHVISATAGGGWEPYIDVGATEFNNNPDGFVLDTNPYDIVAAADGLVVADAGGNDLIKYDAGGETVLGVFPFVTVSCTLEITPGTYITVSIPMQPVPTSVEEGPDGAYRVGELTGFCFPVGEADVYRVEEGQPWTIDETGFTSIVDIDYDAAGNLYILQMTTNGLMVLEGQIFAGGPVTETGRLIRVAPDGTQTVLASEGLIAPTGLTIGPDGNAYITNNTVWPDQGQVIRLSLNPTSVSLSGLSGAAGSGGLGWLPAVLAIALPAGALLLLRRRRAISAA